MVWSVMGGPPHLFQRFASACNDHILFVCTGREGRGREGCGEEGGE